jgi:capsule polysaccharide modification protein KpsS
MVRYKYSITKDKSTLYNVPAWLDVMSKHFYVNDVDRFVLVRFSTGRSMYGSTVLLVLGVNHQPCFICVSDYTTVPGTTVQPCHKPSQLPTRFEITVRSHTTRRFYTHTI